MRPVDADELVMFPYSEGPGTEEQIAEWIEQAGLSEDDTADRARELCWMVIEGCINVVKTQPTLTPPNEWVAVEERLPEDEARQYIKDELDGIGYLYPCLLTYKSPNTERIHVVRFYYDIIQKWFVNNGEELCEKGRCIAWMPLPAPYDRRPPEGEEDT